MNEKKLSRPLISLIVSIALIIVGIAGSFILQTNSGKTTIRNVTIESESGHTLAMDVYIPENATAETPAPASNVLRAGGLVLEPSSYTVTMNNQPINLTKKEFDLLKYLMSHKGEAVTRDALLTDVWSYDYAGDTNVVDVYIRYLRHKIDEPFGVKTLHTIRAVGYMFRVDD